jgi:hypothetical protein
MKSCRERLAEKCDSYHQSGISFYLFIDHIAAVVKVRFSAVDVDVNYEIAQQLFCDRAQTTIILQC